MGATFRSGHLLPPHNEYFSFAESITQRRTVKKMGWSDGYTLFTGNSKFYKLPTTPALYTTAAIVKAHLD
jgi:hypothetical protein